MNGDYWSALISAGGVVISAFVSWLISHSATKKEMHRLERTWQHDDVISSDEEFAKMAGLVARYVASKTLDDCYDTCEAVAAIRSKESGELGRALDTLYKAVRMDTCRPSEIDSALSCVIEEKRKAKRRN